MLIQICIDLFKIVSLLYVAGYVLGLIIMAVREKDPGPLFRSVANAFKHSLELLALVIPAVVDFMFCVIEVVFSIVDIVLGIFLIFL